MKLEEDDPVINCFREMGEGLIPMELVNGELPTQIKGLEKFVYNVYCATGPTTLPALNLSGKCFAPKLRRRDVSSYSCCLATSH